MIQLDVLIWVGFLAGVAALLAVDLLLQRGAVPTLRYSLVWSGVWLAVGLGFAGGVWLWRGPADAGSYTAAYLVEKSLSIDNCFVFALVFAALGVPEIYRRRVLFWGVLGALAARGIFIAAGLALLDTLRATLYVFAAILVYSAYKLYRNRAPKIDVERSRLVRLLGRALPTTSSFHGSRFLVRLGGRLTATPLLVALIAIETADVVFAIDSVPATLAITNDAFLVFSANALALLGLRSLSLLIGGSLERFQYLHLGMAAILGLAGVKMALSDVLHVPVGIAVAATAGILLASVAPSLLTRRSKGHGSEFGTLAREDVVTAPGTAGSTTTARVALSGSESR